MAGSPTIQDPRETGRLRIVNDDDVPVATEDLCIRFERPEIHPGLIRSEVVRHALQTVVQLLR